MESSASRERRVLLWKSNQATTVQKGSDVSGITGVVESTQVALGMRCGICTPDSSVKGKRKEAIEI